MWFDKNVIFPVFIFMRGIPHYFMNWFSPNSTCEAFIIKIVVDYMTEWNIAQLFKLIYLIYIEGRMKWNLSFEQNWILMLINKGVIFLFYFGGSLNLVYLFFCNVTDFSIIWVVINTLMCIFTFMTINTILFLAFLTFIATLNHFCFNC